MKLKFIYLAFSLVLCSVLFIASKDGRAFSEGKGNTGAPGDELNTNGTAKTCQSCHNTSSSIQVSVDIEVRDDAGSVVTEYISETTYDVKVTINTLSGSPSAFGFQLLCLDAPLNVPGNNWDAFSNAASNVRIATATNGRQYAEHKGPSNSNEFMVQWTAPAAGSGTITLYSCGNGVNLNDSSSGDRAACSQLQLTEGESTAVEDFAEAVSLNIFPNPVDDVLNVAINSQESGSFDLQIYNLLGQMVKAEKLDLQTGNQQKSINLSDLTEGTYFLQLSNGEKLTSRKVVKR